MIEVPRGEILDERRFKTRIGVTCSYPEDSVLKKKSFVGNLEHPKKTLEDFLYAFPTDLGVEPKIGGKNHQNGW